MLGPVDDCDGMAWSKVRVIKRVLKGDGPWVIGVKATETRGGVAAFLANVEVDGKPFTTTGTSDSKWAVADSLNGRLFRRFSNSQTIDASFTNGENSQCRVPSARESGKKPGHSPSIDSLESRDWLHPSFDDSEWSHGHPSHPNCRAAWGTWWKSENLESKIKKVANGADIQPVWYPDCSILGSTNYYRLVIQKKKESNNAVGFSNNNASKTAPTGKDLDLDATAIPVFNFRNKNASLSEQSHSFANPPKSGNFTSIEFKLQILAVVIPVFILLILAILCCRSVYRKKSGGKEEDKAESGYSQKDKDIAQNHLEFIPSALIYKSNCNMKNLTLVPLKSCISQNASNSYQHKDEVLIKVPALAKTEHCVTVEDLATNYDSALSYVNRKSGYVTELSNKKNISSPSNENQSKSLEINIEVKPALFQKLVNAISFSSKTSANADEYSERIIEAANNHAMSTSDEKYVEQKGTLFSQIKYPLQNDAIHPNTGNGGAGVETSKEVNEEDHPYYSWRNMPITRPAPSSHIVSKAYTPKCPDEIELLPGDIIGIETIYDDGWARAQNISQGGKRCMVPMNFLSFIKTGPSQNVANGAPTPLQYDKRDSVFNDIVPPRMASKRRNVETARLLESNY